MAVDWELEHEWQPMPLPDAGKKGALSLSSGHVEGRFVHHQPCGHGTGNSLFHSGACAVPGSVLAAADSAMNETLKSLLSGSLRVVNRKNVRRNVRRKSFTKINTTRRCASARRRAVLVCVVREGLWGMRHYELRPDWPEEPAMRRCCTAFGLGEQV